jgi:hypothetical protein
MLKQPPQIDSKEMFVQYVMQPLVLFYKKFFTESIQGQTNEIRKAHTQVKEAFANFLPLDKAIFSMVVEQIPSPIKSMPIKVNSLARDFAENTPIY